MNEQMIEDHHAETAWAMSLGFESAEEYHRASDEAFAEWARYQA